MKSIARSRSLPFSTVIPTAMALLVGVVAACSSNTGGSSSGGGGTNPALSGVGGSAVACTAKSPAGTSLDETSCRDCVLAGCLSELQAVVGSDPARFGGACGELSTCTCSCGPTDVACAQACLPKSTAACTSASDVYQQCRQAKCAAPCAPGSSDGGVAKDGAPPTDAAATGTLQGGCTGQVDQEVYPGGRACTDIYAPAPFDYRAACEGGGETFYPQGCPSAGRTGRCTTPVPPNMTGVQMYYAIPAGDAKTACEVGGGTFEAN